jgi:bacterioferritin
MSLAQQVTAESIRHAVEQGAITAEYKADPAQVVKALNRLRSTEVTSYLQYKQHAYMAVSLLAPGLKSEFESHAAQELQHADLLAERIQQLRGVPIYSPEEIAAKAAQAGVRAEQGPTLTDMVAENLVVERKQIEAYTALIRELGEKDVVTRQLLITILGETEKHASELADYLKRTTETHK